MKAINAILLSSITAAVGVGITLAATGDPAVYEVSNLQTDGMVVQFVRDDPAPATTPATPTATAPVLAYKKIKICSSVGGPIVGACVEWYQRYGEHYVFKSKCVTDASGSCMIEGEPESNGQIRVTQQYSAPMRFDRVASETELGRCEAQ
jgi:hypothetical protein